MIGAERPMIEERNMMHRTSTRRSKFSSRRVLRIGAAVAGVALLVALAKSLSVLPFVPRLIDQIPLLTQDTAMRPAMMLPAAAGLTVVALWLVRSLASTDR